MTSPHPSNTALMTCTCRYDRLIRDAEDSAEELRKTMAELVEVMKQDRADKAARREFLGVAQLNNGQRRLDGRRRRR